LVGILHEYVGIFGWQGLAVNQQMGEEKTTNLLAFELAVVRSTG
jgi:hypothetical protein